MDGAETGEQLPTAARHADIVLHGWSVRHWVEATEAEDRSAGDLRSVYLLVGLCLTERVNPGELALFEMISSFTLTTSS